MTKTTKNTRLIQLFLAAMLLLPVVAMSQTGRPYVIKKEMEGQNHYLAHVKNGDTYELRDATSFNPATCIWMSGPNVGYNYFFVDDENHYRYLSAPLQTNGTLSLSSTHPGTVVLNSTTSGYYFYDWDQGVARGEQITNLNEEQCNAQFNGYSGGQCWKVVWVSYESGNWKMSSTFGYNPTDYAAKTQHVTVTEHEVEITTSEGGVPNLDNVVIAYNQSLSLNVIPSSFSCTYIPAYTTYVFEGGTHNYYNAADQGVNTPSSSTLTNPTPTYSWTITGEGAEYLSLSATDVVSPTLTCNTENTSTSHKIATLTLTVNYGNGVTQVRTATVTVKTHCQNPIQASAPEASYNDVTLYWNSTADKYKLEYKTPGQSWSEARSIENITNNHYRITGSDFTVLGYGVTYDYRVSAYCGNSYQNFSTEDELKYQFTTLNEPGLFILGSVYGGGRMADVDGGTEIVAIDCDSVKAVFGGNDIAGIVRDSSNIILGVNLNDTNATKYNNGNASTKVRIFDVYGGGNGYYAYNGTSFQAASKYYTSQSVAAGGVVKAMTQTGEVGTVVWTNSSEDPVPLTFPKINNTVITVVNDAVRVDSLFGGAKNAFITDKNNDDLNYGSNITFKGGTAYAVFGGNNVGGGQGYGLHHILVAGTKTDLVNANAEGDRHHGFGRSFGIAYLFGGGNKVFGSTTDIVITGGQCDTVFAGGNAASVYAARATVNCPIASGSGSIFGNLYSNAIESYAESTVNIKSNYPWDGSGVYNVRTLFGGNNQAQMTCLPTLTLTSGSAGTVYGGGNAGDMMRQETGGSITFPEGTEFYGDDYDFEYSTHVVMNSPTMLVDNLYGGCQMSNVGYSTWVQVLGGHVGTVYGGCNISGDVGSTRKYQDAADTNEDGSYQEVHGATYVEATGGTVHKDLFAGGNGFYHCLDVSKKSYISGINYDPAGHSYVGMDVPTHNETHVIVGGTAIVEHNVYAGGNMAPVGFTHDYVTNTPYSFPQYVGLASVRMYGGEVKGDVYGGGRMASINGSNEVRVDGGIIGSGPNGGALYGGNDRLGKAGGISNRKLPDFYNTASDEHTPLIVQGDNVNSVNTYVGITGNPKINTVYGGGNGAYTYEGEGADMQYCDASDLPIQTNIFVDVAINGTADGKDGGYIKNVFGGGNGVYVEGFVKVFLNVDHVNASDTVHVGTIYGGNNMGDMHTVVPEIILLRGNVGTVYGGCNSGAMAATGEYTKSFTIGGATYDNVGSYVHLLSDYEVTNTTVQPSTTHHTTPTAKVTRAVYGGCRANGVTGNSLVWVEHGTHSTASFYGGSDISGTIGGTSRVVVTGGTIGNAYGGGNGDYYYANNNVYPNNDHNNPIATGTDQSPIVKPSSTDSRVYMSGGTADNLYGGGNACGSGSTQVKVEGGTVNTGVYGGSNASGTITGDVVVDITGGTIGASTSARANIHGGGFGASTHTQGDVTVNIGATSGGNNPTYSGTAIINGDLYGGSALGQVSASDKTTTVNFYSGTINGDVYGGGLGRAAVSDDPATTDVDETVVGIEAEVSGNVVVNIHGGTFNDANGNANTGYNSTAGGKIYGCNNANGSPKGDVNVNIYATDHVETPHNNYCPTGITTVEQLNTNKASQAYAINAVFGGGNLAAYIPVAVAEGEAPHKSTVHVYNCDNTIKDVFGGGDAADVGTGNPATFTVTLRANTNVIIDGGRIHRVIGGGNGEDLLKPAANIYGAANTTVYAGLIDEVYGGANRQGSVDAINLDMNHSGSCSNAEVYGAVFGCANAAPYNRSVTTTIECGVGPIGELYGGSKQAYIGVEGTNNATVTLNVYGGTFNSIFAGSQGIAGNPGTPAHIYGNVNLNLYGGTMTNAFGGSDANGNIRGNITVNVLDHEIENCGLDVTNIYGASNNTNYEPTISTSSPVINLMHIKQDAGVRGDVFGGGKNGTVSANPEVNIGYDATTMANISGVVYPTSGGFITAPRAYVSGNVFGGGHAAGVTSPTVNIYSGTVATDVYGGCNSSGTVTGDINVNMYGGTVGHDDVGDLFGGGKGASTATVGNVKVTVSGGTITRNVYGGSALGQVNDATTDLTEVWLTGNGTVNGDIYGGGMGQAGTPNDGQVNGSVEVHVIGGSVKNVFGCNNYNEQPEGTVKVYVNDTTTAGSMIISENVYGGGKLAAFTGTPAVYIQKGTVTGSVFGGGSEASVGGSNVNMSGGTVLTSVFGGCYTSGDVTGNSVVNITGGTIGATNKRGSIHGGGYGQSTNVGGNVTVTFGSNDGAQNKYPILYGDLYGGSALGSVNTSASNNTTVYVYNGTITGIGDKVDDYGNIFGGGLGSNTIPAVVNGKVFVYIGYENKGKATLTNCNVFGCNNINGSPKDDVEVHIYQTAHTERNEAGYFDIDRDYAIYQVFGGGNHANYAPVHDGREGNKTHVTIHGCDNTVEYVYSGGNAADAVGVVTVVQGGRFSEIYGGGNGREVAANIGAGGIGLNVLAGNVSYLFEGSNKKGNNSGPFYKASTTVDPCPGGLFVDSYFFGSNEAEYYGDLENSITCREAGSYEYRYVFAGCRWGIVYGDIKLTVSGGIIESLFGGCKGEKNYSADVRRFPTFAEITEDFNAHNLIPDPDNPNPADTTNRKYSYDLRKYMGYIDPGKPGYPGTEPSYAGHGGNITLIVNGGTIGNMFGGCDVKGNVEGNISITVNESEEDCPLFVGNVYGASNVWYHDPLVANSTSPVVQILKGTIGGINVNLPVNNVTGEVPTEYAGNVFGGGNFGRVTANPVVIVGDGGPNPDVTIKGDVFGGGNEGDVIGSPKVVIVPVTHELTITAPADPDKITDSKGTVQTTHTSNVGEGIIVQLEAKPAVTRRFVKWTVTETGETPKDYTTTKLNYTMGTKAASIEAIFDDATQTHKLTYTAAGTDGNIKVTDVQGNTVNTNADIGEGTVLYIVATPKVTKAFQSWTVTGTGSFVAKTDASSTSFTMGTADAAITANFTSPATYTFNFSCTNGAVAVEDATGASVNNGDPIAEGAVLSIKATANTNYVFRDWSTDYGSIANSRADETTFTMGKENATLTATCVTPYTLTITTPSNGNIKVTDGAAHVVTTGSSVGDGVVLNLKATPSAGYAFKQWSCPNATIANASAPITTMTMGSANATLSAEFVTSHNVTITQHDNGTIKVSNSLGYSVTDGSSVGEGAVLSLKATPHDGYTFTGWTVTGATANNNAETTLTVGTSDITITANFTQN